MTEKKFELEGLNNSPYSRWVTEAQYEDYMFEIEFEKRQQLQRDLDYCADDIDEGEDAADVYASFLRDHEIDESEFKDAMYDRGIDIYDLDLCKKESSGTGTTIPVSFIREFSKDEPDQIVKNAFERLIKKYEEKGNE